jgi:hypothetical protein
MRRLDRRSLSAAGETLPMRQPTDQKRNDRIPVVVSTVVLMRISFARPHSVGRW